jgi:hypothetical protein
MTAVKEKNRTEGGGDARDDFMREECGQVLRDGIGFSNRSGSWHEGLRREEIPIRNLYSLFPEGMEAVIEKLNLPIGHERVAAALLIETVYEQGRRKGRLVHRAVPRPAFVIRSVHLERMAAATAGAVEDVEDSASWAEVGLSHEVEFIRQPYLLLSSLAEIT